jgi:tetratricopeptide (TPR) repeat protein
VDGLRRRFGIDRRQRRAAAALDEGRLDEAGELYQELTRAPDAPAWVWFNYGLVHKLRHAWEPARHGFRRAAEIDPSNFEAKFNLGVVATGLRDWTTARWAWRGLEFDVEGTDGPPDGNFGSAPIRLNATEDGGGEVVWGRRIDPCRARLLSVPTPESGHRWGDLVLHDVVPRGERMLNGQAVAVFDELERMDPSSVPTFSADLIWPEPADADALVALLDDRGLGGENWTESIHPICKECSLAPAHVHEGEDRAEVRRAGTWGLAGSRSSIEAVLGAWKAGNPGRDATAPVEVG